MQHDLVRPGGGPGPDRRRDLGRVARDSGGAGHARRREPPRRVRSCHRHQVDDDLVRAGQAGRRVGLGDDLAGGAQPVRRGGTRAQNGAVGVLGAHPQGAVTGRRGEQRRRAARRQAECHVVQLHVTARRRQPFAVEQAAQCLQVLGEQRQRRAGPRADLAHPVLHAVANA
jgi:hypothetical protein